MNRLTQLVGDSGCEAGIGVHLLVLVISDVVDAAVTRRCLFPLILVTDSKAVMPLLPSLMTLIIPLSHEAQAS